MAPIPSKNVYLHIMNLNIFGMPPSGASNLARALLIRMTWEGGWEWAWLLCGVRPGYLTPTPTPTPTLYYYNYCYNYDVDDDDDDVDDDDDDGDDDDD